MRQSFMQQVREHPLGVLYALLAVCAEVVGMWLLYTRKGSADVDPHRTAVGGAFLILAMTFMAASLWAVVFSAPHNGGGAEGGAPSVGRGRVVRLPAGVRRVAAGVWVVMLVLALTQLGATLTDNLGLRFVTGVVVGVLDLIALISVIVAQVRAKIRQG